MGRLGYDGISVWGGRPHMYRQDLHAQLPEMTRSVGRVLYGSVPVVPAQFRYPSLLASANERVRRESVRYIMDNADNARVRRARLRSMCARA